MDGILSEWLEFSKIDFSRDFPTAPANAGKQTAAQQLLWPDGKALCYEIY